MKTLLRSLLLGSALAAISSAQAGVLNPVAAGSPYVTGQCLTAGAGKSAYTNGKPTCDYSETGVSAAGTTQGDATALNSADNIHVVTTVGSGSGVELPAFVAGRVDTVINKGANALKVYPVSGSSIDALSANAAVTIPAGSSVKFVADTATHAYGLAAALPGANSDITSMTGLTTMLALSQGGSGANLSATGPGVVQQATAGAAFTVGAVPLASQTNLPVIFFDNYGCYGDGTHVDTTCITNALAAVPAGGGIVQGGLNKNYLVDATITISTANTIIRGAGLTATKFTKKSTMTTPLFLFTGANIIGRDFWVFGQTGNTGDGIQIVSWGGGLENVFASYAGSDGIRIGRDSGAFNANIWFLRDVYSEHNGRHGLLVDDGVAPTAPNVNGGTITHLEASNNGGDGVKLAHAFYVYGLGIVPENNTGYGLELSDNANYNSIYGSDLNEGNTAGACILGASTTNNTIHGYQGTCVDSGTGNRTVNALGQNTLTVGSTTLVTPATITSASSNYTMRLASPNGNLELWGAWSDDSTAYVNATTSLHLGKIGGGNLTTLTADAASSLLKGTLSVGTASTTTGTVTLYNASGAGSIKLSPANPSATNYTITVPAANDTAALLGTVQSFTANQTVSGAQLLLSDASLAANPVSITGNPSYAYLKGITANGSASLWVYTDNFFHITTSASAGMTISNDSSFTGGIAAFNVYATASSFSGTLSAGGNLTYTAAAAGPILKQGANGRVGTFVCNQATPVTVSNTSVAVTDAITISLNTVGGTVGLVPPTIQTITAATGFTAACQVGDTSTYNYAIIKNAA